MSDYISRADAIEAVHKYFVDKINNEPHEIDEDGDDVFTDMKSVNALFHHNKMVSKAIKALPSADAEFADMPDIPRYYYEKVVGNMAHEINMLKEQLESADAVQGEWIEREDWNGDYYYDCSVCGESFVLCDGTPSMNLYHFCPNCGARMKGGAE